ncbi:hypothetical protein EXE58_15660 [Nocardioides seonyuensis]|uniref:Uncharacterized protein n=1 Tax=Nocardioides seonyuensis TaxID=2518371 RepID=A0A4V1BML1_9ACTN|nr:hypothetical protein [Nocardioides seonyuensis]QBX56752.1 hypothetical protein EXE58_15660 [Nocardioides seonyuensis]
MTDQTSTNLSVLLRAVSAARSEVEDARRLRAAPGSAPVAAEQRVLLEALEQYAAALSRQGSPMPYRMRDELAMYRAMFSTRRQR